MAVQITERNNGTMIDFGNNVRIERRFRAEPDGSYVWHVYKLKTVADGKHPVHGAETAESHVWVPVMQGTEGQARAEARKLVGE